MTMGEMIPIREVCKATGVNPVTLRAWERRYGLITPHRTEKGHRLYTEANIRQIQDILLWLSRGVTVSQVKPLLDSPIPEENDLTSPWGALRQTFLEAIISFDVALLNQQIDRAFRLYSTADLCINMLEPVLLQLQQRWQGQFGSQLEEVFCNSWLRTKLAVSLEQGNARSTSGPVILASLSDEHCEMGLWLLALMLSADGYNIDILEWNVPASELSLLSDQRLPAALVLFSSQALSAAQLRRQLPRLGQHLPNVLMMAGPAAMIHADELSELDIHALPERATLAYAALAGRLGALS
ncbi:MerR family transcriptional regulator [uncultured Halopseudomonas sp.]|uniref:MerR family transcriptional regulator n=1 Tax=uncultured Halopseudomonas sp. TaxID=2901193 RepID=UPI0030EC61CF|tara:strand:+ start:112961 stop:113851 length:891 start_codon:yes stop_codon:yes gene_type:complete